MAAKVDAKAAGAAGKKEEKKKPVVAAAVAAARPLITVYDAEGKATKNTVRTPNVLLAPIRHDIVHFVHTSMSKNRRQAYGVSYNTGMQHSAESWGTGRAVARIPRISGGGTSRAGQGAFGNQVRGGRMFAPTKIWRKWHRKINQNQKRYAVASALAASALTSLVQARGHRVDGIPEVPLVVADAVQDVTKTKQAIKVLEALHAYADVQKAKDSRKLRAGVGKMRNRRHVQRRGPLVVYNADNGITKAFRNLPGVELAHVDRLNLLQLAPGGHLGRFIIWTQSALKRLDETWGSVARESTTKTGYTLPRPQMVQSDVTRLINSDEVQSRVRPAIKEVRRAVHKKNPLTNLGALVTLNPYALALRRSELLTSSRRAAERKLALEKKRKGDKTPSKHAAPLIAAEKKANKKHGKTQHANFVRLSGEGNPDRKPVVPEEPVAAPAKEDKKVEKPVAGKPAAAAAAGTKPAAGTPAPAADKPAPAAAPAKPADAGKKEGDGKKDGAKKDGEGKKGGDKPKDGKKDDGKKGGDKPKDAAGGKKEGGKQGGDKPAGDKPKDGKPKGDKPAGDKKPKDK